MNIHSTCSWALAGKALEQHAQGTAEVLNRIDPHFIRVRTFIPQQGCDLYDEIKTDTFRKAGHETILREQRALIEALEVTATYLSDHLSNYVPVNGKLRMINSPCSR